MDKKLSSSYALLDFFNLPYPTHNRDCINKETEVFEGVKHKQNPEYVEIQLSLLTEVSK